MVLMPEFADEIIPFAKLALDLGVDYGVIKHCSDDEFCHFGDNSNSGVCESCNDLNQPNTDCKQDNVDTETGKPVKRSYNLFIFIVSFIML